MSLSKIGDSRSVAILNLHKPTNGRERGALDNAIRYLQLVLDEKPNATDSSTVEEASSALGRGHYGEARWLCERMLPTSKAGTLEHLELLFALASACAGMADVGTAIHLIEPILPVMPPAIQPQVNDALAQWLWSDLVFASYIAENDVRYLLAMQTTLDLALASTDPDALLLHSRWLTRWLELVGEGSLANWVRTAIAIAAPGTWYVDRKNRDQCVRRLDQSLSLRSGLARFEERLRDTLPRRFSHMLHIPEELIRSPKLFDC